MLMDWPFVPHQRYVRRSEIHALFGGNQQGGISIAPKSHAIFLFTGSGGDTANYADGYLPDGTFRYTGEGQVGDQQFVRGNKALRDHQKLGYDVLLFEKIGSTPSVKFVGQFLCETFDTETQMDRDGQPRQAIVFHLVPLEQIELATEHVGTEEPGNLTELRNRAYAAAAPAQKFGTESRRSVYRRSADVKAYVLKRSEGYCEACAAEAPFARTDGTPYLEPHHIDRLSDGGPDSPDRVAALCPNCHREAHHGSRGVELNNLLREKIFKMEQRIWV